MADREKVVTLQNAADKWSREPDTAVWQYLVLQILLEIADALIDLKHAVINH